MPLRAIRPAADQSVGSVFPSRTGRHRRTIPPTGVNEAATDPDIRPGCLTTRATAGRAFSARESESVPESQPRAAGIWSASATHEDSPSWAAFRRLLAIDVRNDRRGETLGRQWTDCPFQFSNAVRGF